MIEKRSVGAIDIGSNAVRMLIADVEDYTGTVTYKKTAFLRVPIRLGEDVFVRGRIGEEKQRRLCEAMQGFVHVMNAYGVELRRACATSAMREAANGPQTVRMIRECSDVRVEIISGQEEADLIFSGGMRSLMDPAGSYLLVDVGGGSTEVTVYAGRRRVDSRSFSLGTVRMLSGAVPDGECDRFREWLRQAAFDYAPTTIIGSGGNINKAQKLMGRKEKEAISLGDLKSLYGRIKSLSYEERIHKMGMNTYRADVIVPALKIFLTAAKSSRVERFVVPKLGLVDGIVHRLYREAVPAAADEPERTEEEI